VWYHFGGNLISGATGINGGSLFPLPRLPFVPRYEAGGFVIQAARRKLRFVVGSGTAAPDARHGGNDFGSFRMNLSTWDGLNWTSHTSTSARRSNILIENARPASKL